MQVTRGLHPLVGLGLAVFFLSFGLTIYGAARMWAYVAGLLLLVLALGYHRPLLSVMKFTLPMGLVVGTLTWLISGSWQGGVSVLSRFSLFGLTTCLVMAINPSDMAKALDRLKCPRKISLGFLITVRFIPVLKDEIKRISEAARIRGLNLSWRNMASNYRVLLLPLVVRLINISDTLSLSLETRAFSAAHRPTIYQPPHLGWQDYFSLPAACCLVGLMIWWPFP